MKSLWIKLAVGWVAHMVVGTLFMVKHLDKEDKECEATCTAQGKEAVFMEKRGSKLYRLSSCECSE